MEDGEGIGFKPPIGLLYVATYLKEKTPHSVEIIDAQAERLGLEETLSRVLASKPDVVGISAWTDWWYSAHQLGRMIKGKMPEAHICYGGPHAAIYPEETIQAAHTDSVIAGDGEAPFAALCDMVAKACVNNDFPGLHFKRYGAKEGDARFFIQKNLDELPLPDRTLLPIRNYSSLLGTSNFVTTMLTSRGCPYRCTYCKLSHQKTACRSAQSVIEEFKEIERLGIKEVEVYDDTFTWSKARAMDICRGLIEQNVKVAWAARDRVNAADPELLDLMKKAGCTRIHYGIESGVDRIIELMKKNITTGEARRAVSLAKERGFTVLVFFMLGNKGETAEDIRRTIDFALGLDADYAEFSITIPYPGTEMYLEALSKNIINRDYWRAFAANPTADFRVPQLYEENLAKDELTALRDEAVRRYYFRGRYIIREIAKIRRWSEFQRKAKMGLRLAFSSMRGVK